MTEPVYVIISCGELSYWTYDKDDLLTEARIHVQEYINNFCRHDMPLKVTADIAKSVDLRVYELNSDSQWDLPLQEWFDDWYNEIVEEKANSKEREYQRFLELREKYEDRFLQEQLNAPSE